MKCITVQTINGDEWVIHQTYDAATRELVHEKLLVSPGTCPHAAIRRAEEIADDCGDVFLSSPHEITCWLRDHF